MVNDCAETATASSKSCTAVSTSELTAFKGMLSTATVYEETKVTSSLSVGDLGVTVKAFIDYK